jgi:hypothetical protein
MSMGNLPHVTEGLQIMPKSFVKSGTFTKTEELREESLLRKFEFWAGWMHDE